MLLYLIKYCILVETLQWTRFDILSHSGVSLCGGQIDGKIITSYRLPLSYILLFAFHYIIPTLFIFSLRMCRCAFDLFIKHHLQLSHKLQIAFSSSLQTILLFLPPTRKKIAFNHNLCILVPGVKTDDIRLLSPPP